MRRKIDSASAARLNAGLAALARNVRRLSGDADFLFKSGRYPGAAASSIMALEQAMEIGRHVGVVFDPTGMGSARKKLKGTNEHVRRLFFGLLMSLREGREKGDDDIEACLFMATVLQRQREAATYVDWEDGEWHEPDKINKALAETIVRCARRAAQAMGVPDLAMLLSAYRPLAELGLKLFKDFKDEGAK